MKLATKGCWYSRRVCLQGKAVSIESRGLFQGLPKQKSTEGIHYQCIHTKNHLNKTLVITSSKSLWLVRRKGDVDQTMTWEWERNGRALSWESLTSFFWGTLDFLRNLFQPCNTRFRCMDYISKHGGSQLIINFQYCVLVLKTSWNNSDY